MKNSIREKIQSAFRVMSWLMVTVAVIGGLALFAVYRSANRALRVGARLNQVGLEIEINHLDARRNEEDFLLNVRTEGVDQAKQRYASRVARAVTALRQLAEVGEHLAMGPGDRSRFRKIDELARSYTAAFDGMVAAKERRGHVDSGAEGQFRTAAHRIEAQLNHWDKIEIAMLTMRRSEKDYLLRGDPKYITATLENVHHLKKAIDGAPLQRAAKASAEDAAEAYRAAFMTLVEADQDVAARSAAYQEASRRLEAAAGDAATAGERASRQSLAAASWTAVVAVAAVALLSLGTIVAGIRYSNRISLEITRPVRHLTEVAEHVSLGDLSLRVERTCDDEIGELEDSLARLVAAVRFFQSQPQEEANPVDHGVYQ